MNKQEHVVRVQVWTAEADIKLRQLRSNRYEVKRSDGRLIGHIQRVGRKVRWCGEQGLNHVDSQPAFLTGWRDTEPEAFQSLLHAIAVVPLVVVNNKTLAQVALECGLHQSRSPELSAFCSGEHRRSYRQVVLETLKPKASHANLLMPNRALPLHLNPFC